MCKCNCAIVCIWIIIIMECEKLNTLSGFVHTVEDARCPAVSRKRRGGKGLEKEHVSRGIRCCLCGVACFFNNEIMSLTFLFVSLIKSNSNFYIYRISYGLLEIDAYWPYHMRSTQYVFHGSLIRGIQRTQVLSTQSRNHPITFHQVS